MIERWVLVGVIVAALTVVVLAGNLTNRPGETGQFTVAATIFPLADMVKNIAGEEAKVVQVVPAGASEHSYSLTPRQVAEVQGAKVIFIIGHGMDDAIAAAVAKASGAQVVTVDEGIERREFAGGGVDPHYWLTVPNAKKMAATVAARLQQVDPDRAGQYEGNLAVYLERLDSLEAELQAVAGGIEQRNFIAMHDAWSYFAEQYGLNLVATYEPVEGKQPSVADLKRLGELVSDHGITVFYAEPQKSSVAATRFLGDEFGLQIRELDPVGGAGVINSYIELMLYNMRTLAAN